MFEGNHLDDLQTSINKPEKQISQQEMIIIFIPNRRKHTYSSTFSTDNIYRVQRQIRLH